MSKKNSLLLLNVAFCIPPGATLEEEIDAMGISQKELAQRTGLTVQTINRIIKGSTPITTDTAQKLAYVTNTSASFWLGLEMDYREALKQQSLGEEETKNAAKAFVREFPYKELVDRGACKQTTNPAEMKEELLRFFAVSGESQYRRTYESVLEGAARVGFSQKWNSGAFSAWLRLGEIAASKIETRAFSYEKLKNAIQEVRSSVNDSPDKVWGKLQAILSDAGVAAVVIPELKGTHAYGFSRFITPDKAIVQLSLKGGRVGTFWFNLFHELCHLLKHGKKKVFVNLNEQTSDKYADSKCDKEEKEANKFSRDILISPMDWKYFMSRGNFSIESIRNFAEYLKIPMDIILGRLQKDKIIHYAQYVKYQQKVKPLGFEVSQIALSVDPFIE